MYDIVCLSCYTIPSFILSFIYCVSTNYKPRHRVHPCLLELVHCTMKLTKKVFIWTDLLLLIYNLYLDNWCRYIYLMTLPVSPMYFQDFFYLYGEIYVSYISCLFIQWNFVLFSTFFTPLQSVWKKDRAVCRPFINIRPIAP